MTMPALTGIRGIAALWVFCFHLSLFRGWAGISEGYLAVDLFFILSGFILSFAHEKTLYPGFHSALAFYRNRIARIFPLHLFALFLVVLCVAFVPAFSARQPEGFYAWSTFPLNVFLVQTWTDFSAGWNGPSWSLSAEWLAYLAFPFLMLTVKRLTERQRVALAVLLLAGQTLVYYATSAEQMAHAGKTGILRVAVGFSVGMLCYQIHKATPPRIPSYVVLCGLLACLLIEFLRPWTVWFFAMTILLCAQKDNIFVKIFSSKPAVFLGEISFSVYILQWSIIELALTQSDKMNPALLYTLITGATLALTLFSYRFIEKPSRAWGKKWGAPLKAKT